MEAPVRPPFVLASSSPRRRQLLEDAGIRFEVVAPLIAESASAALSVRELTMWNATRKALEVARVRPDAVALGADTLVSLEGQPIGKPADFDEAREILRRLSGRMHDVCTGVFVCADGGKRATGFHVWSGVQFRSLSDTAITAYLAKINPLDKAGAYAAQGHGAEIIQEIRGSYTNVVGLPMEETLRTLRRYGISAV